MKVVEVVAGFEVMIVEEAVGGVNHPDCDEHSGGCCPRKLYAGATSEEVCPKCGYGWSVQREQMPKGKKGMGCPLRKIGKQMRA
jgi:hypothetical protein